MFYCEKITSSNDNDVVLENKCIICNKTDEETYFNFISNDENNIILKHITDYYSFGNMLSDAEFNSIVQLLRVNNPFAEDIQIKNSTVNGKYGTYVFNLKSTTIVDNGVLITNETLSSIGTVKLINPTFKNSNYKLKLTVYSLSDVNVCDEANTDNIVETDLIIDLIQGSEVNIPFNTLDLNCIVGFNAVVNITHDLPVIQYPQNIVLTSDKLSCIIGESVTLTATFGEEDSPLTDEPITFKNNGTVLGTAVTNSNGVANFTYAPLTSDNLNITATNRDGKIISNNLEVEVNKKPTTISLNVNSNSVELDDDLILSGHLEGNDGALSDCPVSIVIGHRTLYSTRTDANGDYSITDTIEELFSVDLKAVYEGDAINSNCESSYVNVKGVKKSVTVVNAYSRGTAPGLLSGKLVTKDGTPLGNVPISIRWVGYNTDITTNLRTNSDGTFSETCTSEYYIVNMYFNYAGDATHDSFSRRYGW